jgi:DTW domain-containing protein
MDQEFTPRCYTCFRPKKNCLCAFVKKFKSNIHIVLLMHPQEAKKQRLGTGRLTRASLINSEIVVDIDFSQNKRVNQLIEDPNKNCFLLYPGNDASNISNNDIPQAFQQPKSVVLFVVDATWPMAKKIMRLSRNLQYLPKVCFDLVYRSQFSIKHQPNAYCLSTIESVYYLLDNLDKKGVEQLDGQHSNLLTLLDRMVKFQIECAENPNLTGYRRHNRPKKVPKTSRVREKKNRNFCFDLVNFK